MFDDVLCLLRDLVPFWRRETENTHFDFVNQHLGVLFVESMEPTKQRVQDTPKPPDINTFAMLLPLDHLWCNITRGAARRVGPEARPNLFGEPKVTQLDLQSLLVGK
eukprot:Lithocolla_globosa_v1_NODE_4460_length_1430_cov_4.437818.p3 type:complete len:107 gc:universal NODE_4460_length_1430_cov_4.437818:1093-1413(+)